jgi:hypothetical protein
MDAENKIALNFIAFDNQAFSFKVYRKSRQPDEKNLNLDFYGAKLPPELTGDVEDDANKGLFWVVFEPRENFEEFICRNEFDWNLTKKYILQRLKQNTSSLIQLGPKEIFRERVSFVIGRHPEGDEIIWLEPYYLLEQGLFGILIDFEFRKNQEEVFSKKIQVLSLSLDRHYRSNRDFYYDKYKKVEAFIQSYLPRLFPIITNTGHYIKAQPDLLQVPSYKLKTKEYIFALNRRSKSQFKGLLEYGPLKKFPDKICYYFICREQDVSYANQLYKALKGDTFPSLFHGMSQVFKLSTGKNLVRGKSWKNLDQAEFEKTILEIEEIKDATTIPILIIPPKLDEKNKKIYFLAKYLFSKRDLPLQVITLDLLRNEDSLKWSIANIGLQIFAKLGGQPWKVNPENDDCLIIGIGQAHKQIKEGSKVRIERYYAYSVLTDSSGLYLDLQVLGEGTNEADYLVMLRHNLSEVLEKYKYQFRKVVIHTSFRVKESGTKPLLRTLREISYQSQEMELVVIKVNTDNKFFGYDKKINSLVPYESTYLKIAPKEYLVWFEGLQYHNPNVQKRYPGPTHVEFLSIPKNPNEIIDYLQDVLNLSGANWRGFNAKALPVSIHYCRLVAKFIQEFDSRGYSDFKIDNLKPWFL